MNEQTQAAITKLREIEDLLRRLDDTPARDALPDRVYTALRHDEATNRIKITVDCHLSRASSVMQALSSNCQNLADYYLTTEPPTTPPDESETD